MPPADWLQRHSLRRFQNALLRWYDRQGRDLPWRNCSDPYPVWVSEIMLQQTQVATVLRYFQPFLTKFPTIAALAEAPEEEVLHAWQGLGYYRRARNLHHAARVIVNEHQGKFPSQVEIARQLPGLGRYTANAILCFAANQRLPILEANTVRVWTRLTAAASDPAKALLNGQLWHLAEAVLPERRAAEFNQALMDLGSMVCTASRPACEGCPVKSYCCAYDEGNPESYPAKAKRTPSVDVEHVAVILRDQTRVLVRQCPPDGRWANLWEFPRVERQEGENLSSAATRALASVTSAPFTLLGQRQSIQHGIMHYRVTLHCFAACLSRTPRKKKENLMADPRRRWVEVDALESLPFSSPQRKLVRLLQAELASEEQPA